MIRATTPTFRFVLPEAAENYSDFLLTISQNNKNLLNKGKEDLTLIDHSVNIRLTQAEANLFEAGQLMQLQLRAAKASVVYATRIYNVVVNPALNDSILTNIT